MAKRIFHLISELAIGGTERSLLKVLPYLRHDFENVVICAIGRGLVGQELEDAGIRVVYLDGRNRFDFRPAWQLHRKLRKEKPDRLVTYLIYADIVGRVVGRLAGIKKIISFQRSSLHDRGYLRWLEWLTAFFVDQYAVQRATLRVLSRRVAVIPNVVELPDISGRRPSSTLTVVCVSNLRPEKGHVYLLRAWEKIQPKFSEAVLQLVGDGSLREELPRTARTDFLGSLEKVEGILAGADVFVLPSLAEGMSNALLEAMSWGLPCIACDISANQAIITSGSNGLLVPPRDVQALASALECLLDNAGLRQRLGSAARIYVEQYHAPHVIVPLWRQLLS